MNNMRTYIIITHTYNERLKCEKFFIDNANHIMLYYRRIANRELLSIRISHLCFIVYGDVDTRKTYI